MKNQFVPDSKHTPSTLKAPEVEVSKKKWPPYSQNYKASKNKLCGKDGMFL
jgi:hypothetical protein